MIARPLCSPEQRGFSLIELLVVMVLIGILSTLAVGRFGGKSEFDQLGYAEEMAAAARYAQKLAVATRCPVRFELSSPGSYRLRRPDGFTAGTCSANFNAEVTNPATAQAPYAGVPPSGITASVGGGFPVTIVFDAQGAPSSTGDVSVQIGPRTVLVRGGSGQVLVQASSP